jgi:hypothetical protein
MGDDGGYTDVGISKGVVSEILMWFYRSKPDFKLNMSSIAFDANSLSNRILNRLAAAHPLMTYMIVLSSSSRVYFLFPQHTPAILIMCVCWIAI